MQYNTQILTIQKRKQSQPNSSMTNKQPNISQFINNARNLCIILNKIPPVYSPALPLSSTHQNQNQQSPDSPIKMLNQTRINQSISQVNTTDYYFSGGTGRQYGLESVQDIEDEISEISEQIHQINCNNKDNKIVAEHALDFAYNVHKLTQSEQSKKMRSFFTARAKNKRKYDITLPANMKVTY